MKRLLLAITAMAAIASCSKESSMDVAITSTQTPMEFTTYASSAATKGAPIDSNDELKTDGNAFEVSAYFTSSATSPSNSGKYFDFSTVTYDTSWENTDDMYWPNEDGNLYFGAYYPSGDTGVTASYAYTSSAHDFDLTYTVADAVKDQSDLMYAITEREYTYSSAGTQTAVNLHFKHALTQIAFTATKDSNIDVSISDVQICNVINKGDFTASIVTDDGTTIDGVDTDDFGSWTKSTTTTDIKNYAIDLDGTTTPIAVADSGTTTISEEDDALMLIPQALTAWEPTADETSTKSYLAIKCKITHAKADGDTDVTYASIIDGYVFVPFSTDDLDYDGDASTTDDVWKPGYKITYNLHFGGGYISSTGTVPDPGKTPTGTTATLQPITYTTTVDTWIDYTDDGDSDKVGLDTNS